MSGLDHRRREDADLGGEDDSDGEELDPRVQQELEKLNACTEEINLLETHGLQKQNLLSMPLVLLQVFDNDMNETKNIILLL